MGHAERRKWQWLLTGVLVSSLCGASALADGTEALGPPVGLTVASGSDVLIAGVGLLKVQPGTISINIPPNVSVRQVLLYWEGQDLSQTGQGNTDQIILNGSIPVIGRRIGGPTVYLNKYWTSSYRADITGLGLVRPGSNAFTVQGLDFSAVNNGAGVLVIVDDGGSPANIQLADGNDFAFFEFPPPLDTTAPVTYNFAPAPVVRTAHLRLFASSVALEDPSGLIGRPTTIQIWIDGVLVESIADALFNSDGPEWDSFRHDITVPPGASSITVQVLSQDSGQGAFAGRLPASLTWVTSAMALQECTGIVGDFVWDDRNHDGLQTPGEPGIGGVRLTISKLVTDDLVVSSLESNQVLRFDSQNGIFKGAFTVGGALDGPDGLAFGPDGNLYVSSYYGQQVSRFDGQSGAFLGVLINHGNLNGPEGLAFGPDGKLYVANSGNGQVQRYDPQTGQFIDVFASLVSPVGLGFSLCADGKLYVSSFDGNAILRYADPQISRIGAPGVPAATAENSTGEVFASGGDLRGPAAMTTGPDGNLYVSSFYRNAVLRYDCQTGAYLGIFASGGGLTQPFGLTFGPDGNLYVASFGTSRILRFNGRTGAFMNVFASGGGLTNPTFLTYSSQEIPIAETITDPNGFYNFTELCAGTYVVRVDETTLPPGYQPTLSNVGANRALDSNGSPARVVLPANNTQDLTIDFGYNVALAAIGDFVWEDRNANGVQDVGEPGIPNVTVSLTDCAGNPVTDANGNPVLPKTTNASGFYQFTNLIPGQYQVVFTRPGGYAFTQPFLGGNPARDSNANTTTGKSDCRTLAPGQYDNTVDAGLFKSTSIGDFVWEDRNANGVQDIGEPGIPNVTVSLTDCAGNPVTDINGNPVLPTTTDANGFYQFTNLKPGQYQVVFTRPNGYAFTQPFLGGNPARDSNANTTTGRSDCRTLVAGQYDDTVDAGLFKTTGIGDFVWEDKNANGVQDAGEPGIPNVTVSLTDCAGNPVTDINGNPVLPTTTNANGFYQFTNLKPGQYQVVFSKPNGYIFTAPFQGSDTAKDSNANTVDGRSECRTLVAGQFDDTVDAGLYKPAAIGDFVWEDKNANGVQDAGEPGIPNVTVSLTDCAGNPVTNVNGVPVAPVVTSANGLYSFTNLKPGQYQVVFTKPNGYVFTQPFQNGDTAKDSNADTTTGKSDCRTLVSGQTDLTVDAGLYKPASLGDFVWDDQNGNGVQDTGEPGIPDVVVTLTDCTGNPVTDINGNLVPPTTTDANGLYHFTNLKPGQYQVVFLLPGGYTFTAPFQGSDPAKDSNADTTTGKSDCRTLVSGQTDNTVDAGLISQANCDLVLEKTCTVPPPPPTTFVCSDAKPLDQISMQWNGTQAIDVKAWKGAVGSTLLATVPNVQPGSEVTVSGYAGSPNDVIWQLFVAGTNQAVPYGTGKSTFHLSCSDADMNGPEDCGKTQGDGKSLSGYVNEWIFEGMAGNGLVLDCTPASAQPAEACEITPTATPSCDTEGKPTSLTFRYTGEGCAASNNPQSGKFICSGNVNTSLPITVFSKEGYTVTPSTVAPGGEFTVSTSSFAAQSNFTLSNAGGTQSLSIHTSCSQILEVGNIFGNITLVGFNGNTGGNQVAYQYKVTNNGDPLTNVTLVDDKLGVIASGLTLNTGESKTFETSATVNETTVNVATASGQLADGSICQASDSVTVSVSIPPCTDGTSSIKSDFNSTAIPSGRYVWFNSIFKVKANLRNLLNNNGKVTFDQSTIVLQGKVYDVPPAEIRFSSSATQATTTYDSVAGKWITTVPPDYSGNIFLTGLAVLSDGTLGGAKDVTWSGTFSSDTPGVEVEWKWAAAVYSPFTANLASIQVKPIDGDKKNPYANSDHAGTPENFKANVTGGARGGGGSNYTGSYSGTKTTGICPLP